MKKERKTTRFGPVTMTDQKFGTEVRRVYARHHTLSR